MASTRPTCFYRAEGLSPVLEITGDGRIEAALAGIMAGWGLVPAGPGSAEETLRVVQRTGQGAEAGAENWTCSGPGCEPPASWRDPVAAGCGIIAALFKAHTLSDREGLCLHAAGVRFGDGLVLLTGDYRAGKSLLTAACCAAGQQVFSDDIVPLSGDGRAARAPGLALRLRLPLPGGLAPATRDFLAAHRVLESDRYLYVRPAPDRLAVHGRAAPVRAVVALDRGARRPARLARIAPGDALAELIRRNFARETPAGRILDALDGLVTGVPCLRLSYAEVEAAADLLRRHFLEADAAAPSGMPDASAAPPAASRPVRPARDGPVLAPGTLVRRAPGVGMRERGGQTFLTDSGEAAIFNLNPTGSAVWRVIERPARFGELIALFAAAFPERPEDALAADLSDLVRELAARGLACLEAGGDEPKR